MGDGVGEGEGGVDVVDGGAVDAEVEAGEAARHVEVDGEGELDVVGGSGGDQRRELARIVDHEADRGAAGDLHADGGDVVRVDGGVGDEEVGEVVGGEVGGLACAEAQDALKRGAEVEDAPQDAPAADRLGGQTDRLAASAGDQAGGVDLQQLEVDVGERQVLASQALTMVGVA